jgi:hypothetical protein
MNLTPQQHEALVKIHARGPLVWDNTNTYLVTPPDNFTGTPLTVERMENAIRPMMCGDGCVLLPWQGMWLGIETDGYTHS